MEGHVGIARIGNRKTDCQTCNRFGQAVRRRVAVYFKEMYPEEWSRVRARAERSAYADVLDQFKDSLDREQQ